jgi:hypothetical protein
MKNAVLWDVTPCGSCKKRQESIASINRVTRIGELGTTLAVTSNWSKLRKNTNYMERISEVGTTLAVTGNCSTLRRILASMCSVLRLLVAASIVPSSPILVTLMMEALHSSETSVLSWATRRKIPQNGILHSHRRENLKLYTDKKYPLKQRLLTAGPQEVLLVCHFSFLSILMNKLFNGGKILRRYTWMGLKAQTQNA